MIVLINGLIISALAAILLVPLTIGFFLFNGMVFWHWLFRKRKPGETRITWDELISEMEQIARDQPAREKRQGLNENVFQRHWLIRGRFPTRGVK
ncbi:hypothetical protein [Phyllobacterium lublinensis]|uniref:hypothetical protein n=1 Tax=Phyllobacterium lublinensis TaxID=2875708 RepID=UPI001CC96B30|nr:hypothetical protein [Phyllobacterium sp. 2063]MBZ9654672.1 hypothetical protein [Phyllobacterium sp. 2063]